MAISNTEKQRRYRERQAQAGLKPCTIYVPSDLCVMLRSMEDVFKAGAVDVSGIVVRDKATGRVKTLRIA